MSDSTPGPPLTFACTDVIHRSQVAMEFRRALFIDKRVVIVTDVMTAGETNSALNLFWRAMGEMNKSILRDNPTTWCNRNWPRALTIKGLDGMIFEGGFAASDFMWMCRTRPNVISIFSTALQLSRSELIVSLETARALRGENHEARSPIYLHADKENPRLRGALIITTHEPTAGGFCFADSQKSGQIMRIHPPAGSLVLFLSSHPHGFAGAEIKTAYPDSSRLTLAAFVTMWPRMGPRRHGGTVGRLREADACNGIARDYNDAEPADAQRLRLAPRPRSAAGLLQVKSFYRSRVMHDTSPEAQEIRSMVV